VSDGASFKPTIHVPGTACFHPYALIYSKRDIFHSDIKDISLQNFNGNHL
jgi:hypothetical protein